MSDRLPQPYHIYLDLDVINNDVESGAKPHPLIFEETRNSPCLDGDCNNYFCSITRFSIQAGSSLPVFIPRIDTAAIESGDLYKTVYKITLQYGAITLTRNVTFDKRDSSLLTSTSHAMPPPADAYNVSSWCG